MLARRLNVCLFTIQDVEQSKGKYRLMASVRQDAFIVGLAKILFGWMELPNGIDFVWSSCSKSSRLPTSFCPCARLFSGMLQLSAQTHLLPHMSRAAGLHQEPGNGEGGQLCALPVQIRLVGLRSHAAAHRHHQVQRTHETFAQHEAATQKEFFVPGRG